MTSNDNSLSRGERAGVRGAELFVSASDFCAAFGVELLFSETMVGCALFAFADEPAVSVVDLSDVCAEFVVELDASAGAFVDVLAVCAEFVVELDVSVGTFVEASDFCLEFVAPFAPDVELTALLLPGVGAEFVFVAAPSAADVEFVASAFSFVAATSGGAEFVSGLASFTFDDALVPSFAAATARGVEFVFDGAPFVVVLVLSCVEAEVVFSAVPFVFSLVEATAIGAEFVFGVFSDAGGDPADGAETPASALVRVLLLAEIGEPLAHELTSATAMRDTASQSPAVTGTVRSKRRSPRVASSVSRFKGPRTRTSRPEPGEVTMRCPRAASAVDSAGAVTHGASAATSSHTSTGAAAITATTSVNVMRRAASHCVRE